MSRAIRHIEILLPSAAEDVTDVLTSTATSSQWYDETDHYQRQTSTQSLLETSVESLTNTGANTNLPGPYSTSTGVVDDFNRADEVPLSGEGRWRAITGLGQHNLKTNQADRTSSGTFYNLRTNERASDVEIAISETFTPTLSDDLMDHRLLFRISESPTSGTWDGYMLQFIHNSGANDTVNWYRVTNGAATLIKTVSMEWDSPTTFIGRMVGTTIQAWFIDASSVLWYVGETTDATYSTGLYGAGGRSIIRNRWDNFRGGALSGTSDKIAETLANSATSSQSLYEEIGVTGLVTETISNSAVNDPNLYPEEIFEGEENIILQSQESTQTILDFEITYSEFSYVTQTGTQAIVEKVSETASNTGTALHRLEAQDDTLVNLGISSQTIVDVVNGSVTETVNAPGVADTAEGGANVSGVAIHTLAEGDLIDIGEDVVPPTIIAIYYAGNTVTLVYSELLDPGSVPDLSSYVIVVDGTTRTILSVTVNADQVIITFSGAPATQVGNTTSTISITYTAPGVNPLQDESGNDAGSFVAPATDIDPETEDPVTYPPLPVFEPNPPAPNPGKSGGSTVPSYGPAGIGMNQISFRSYSFKRKTGVV